MLGGTSVSQVTDDIPVSVTYTNGIGLDHVAIFWSVVILKRSVVLLATLGIIIITLPRRAHGAL